MKQMTTQKWLSICAALLLTGVAWAQELNLPRMSPKAGASFTIGYTEIKINYSSPAVRDRDIWGVLEPYGEIWRAGANEATTVELNTDVVVEGKSLPAGKYAFFLIPQKEGDWTAIFNKVADQWGAYEYDPSQDALRVNAMANDSEITEEHLNYSIVQQGPDAGYIRLGWEKKRIYVRFKVLVLEQAKKSILEAIAAAPQDRKWRVYMQAAEYLMEFEGQQDLALDYARQSTDLFRHFRNWWVRAQLEAAKGDYATAVASAERAAALGFGNDNEAYEKEYKLLIEGKIAEWKEMK